VSVLDEPIPPGAGNNGKAIKAAAMAAMIGNDTTRGDLVSKLPRVTNLGARLAVAEAIDHLLPNGDVKTAEALEQLVDREKDIKEIALANDALYKVALRLRARAGK
jgi:hypothetical protein